MFNPLAKKKVSVLFKKDFTSPVFGNVWEGRIVHNVDEKQALKFVGLGYAEIIKDEKKAAPPAKEAPQEKGKGDSNSDNNEDTKGDQSTVEQTEEEKAKAKAESDAKAKQDAEDKEKNKAPPPAKSNRPTGKNKKGR